MEERSYRFGSSSLRLVFGDITSSKADVIVSSDDYILSMGGGVSRAIRRKAGESIAIDASKHIPANLADVIVTTAGALEARYVFHAVTLCDHTSELSAADVLDRVTTKCLELVDSFQLNSIAFPAIGAGVAGFSYEDVAVRMADILAQNLSVRNRPLEVSIYLFDRFGNMSPIDFVRFFEEFASKSKNLPQSTKPSPGEGTTEPVPLDPASDIARRKRAAQHLAELTQERDLIEQRLAALGDALEQKDSAALRDRLTHIHSLRLEALSKSISRPANGCHLFISYSHKDAVYRDAMRSHLRALERLTIVAAWFDRMITAGTEWQGQIDERLETSEVILLLISADFIESKYCYDVELTRALERHEQRDALVIPILVRPVVWEDMPFAKLQALPSDRKAVSLWDDKDLAWVDVTEGIRSAIEEFVRPSDAPREILRATSA